MPYLTQQLESLLAQTRLPDRLVIFDDRSDDGTWQYLQAWEAKAPVSVSLHQNAVRQGVIKNFEGAVQALDTDLIFLCDQDDIWLPNKIDLIATVFESSPDVLLVHTDAQLVDADARDLKVSLFEALGLLPQERDQVRTGNAFLALCRRNLVTGATAAFRRSLLNLASPFPSSCLHDEWLAILAAAIGRVRLLDVPTIQYRQHGRNVAGMPLPSSWRSLRRFLSPAGDFQARRVQRSAALLQRLEAVPSVPQRCLDYMRDAMAHARFRSSLPHNPARRIWAVLRESRSGRYKRFSNGVSGILRDMLGY